MLTAASIRAALYWWRATSRNSWRPALAVALLTGLLGAVALGALAGARRTDSAYSRYLVSVRASDAFVNVPGRIPGIPLARPMELISGLPGVTSAASYIGLAANPVVGGRVHDSFQTNDLIGSFTAGRAGGAYFGQDQMTVLAGRMPHGTGQIALSPSIARMFRVGVGGRVTYEFQAVNPRTYATTTVGRRSYLVTAIVDLPPVLGDPSDAENGGVLPPAATRQVLASYEYAWVGVRLTHGTAGIPALQRHLAVLARTVQHMVASAHVQESGLSFAIRNSALLRGQVQQAIRPQAVALSLFGAFAALALLVLVGQAMGQLLGRAAPGITAGRALGATRGQAALAASLPGAAAVLAGVVLAVAGAVALSPLAPVGPVRQFDPVRGTQFDGLVVGAGAGLLAAILLALLAVLAARAVRPGAARTARRPSALAQVAAGAGLPATAVIGSRNALEAGSDRVPVRAVLLGSAAAVTAVVTAVVFGASLTGLLSHPPQYGWNWNVLIQAEGGFGNFYPQATMTRLVRAEPAISAWSEFGFSQVAIDQRVVPAMGVQLERGTVEPPTTSGHQLYGSDEVELGAVTLRQLGKKIGDTVEVGPRHLPLTIVGTVTLPSFGVAITDHVSLGQGAMMSEATLLRAEGSAPNPASAGAVSQAYPSAVAIDLAPGTTTAQRRHLITTISAANPDGTPGGTYALPRSPAAAVVDAARMGSQPLALALGLAGAAVLSLALTILAAVRRRRRELALLKTLGMTRRQLRGIVAWQTTLTLLAAAAAGIPLGIAAGRWAWEAYSGSLGIVPAPLVPAGILLAGLGGLLVAGNVLTSGPAMIAARTAPAAVLRAD